MIGSLRLKTPTSKNPGAECCSVAAHMPILHCKQPEFNVQHKQNRWGGNGDNF